MAHTILMRTKYECQLTIKLRVRRDRANYCKFISVKLTYSVENQQSLRIVARTDMLRAFREHVTRMMQVCQQQAYYEHRRAYYDYYACMLRVWCEYVTSMMQACHEQDASILRALWQHVTSMMSASQ